MSKRDNGTIEPRRLRLQESLDAAKSPAERNRLGQFATPPTLAADVIRLARSLTPPNAGIRFLDPAFGTGSFYSALLRGFPKRRLQRALGYEVDPHYGDAARDLWAGTPLRLLLHDFTAATPPAEDADKATLIVCNPPYVRHHHLGAAVKRRLRMASIRASATDLNGLAGLYCYFISLSHAWMAKEALALWLIPSEFMDVNYGRPLKDYLLNRVTLLRIHRFDPGQVQFDDALVSSAVVCFRNSPPGPQHMVEFTYGGTLTKPERTRVFGRSELDPAGKWSNLALVGPTAQGSVLGPRLSDLFVIKRGIATGANEFFVLGEAKAKDLGLPSKFLRPILPSPRFLRTNEVDADENGNPIVEPRLLLLDCPLPEEEIRGKYPMLWEYLQLGVTGGVPERYLCQHRSPWYSQEDRRPAPILCTYMGRSNGGTSAFRFILNLSRAIAANVYLMLYPQPGLESMMRRDPELLRAVWSALRRIPWEELRVVGRVYGGGLHKLEPRELSAAPLDTVLDALPDLPLASGRQPALSW